MRKCLICGKEADSRNLCRGHYVAAKRLKVLDRFPRSVRSSSIMEAEVQTYLTKEDGGVHPKSRKRPLASMTRIQGPQLLEETHPKSPSSVPKFAECPEHHLKFKNFHGLQIHIGRIHLKEA